MKTGTAVLGILETAEILLIGCLVIKLVKPKQEKQEIGKPQNIVDVAVSASFFFGYCLPEFNSDPPVHDERPSIEALQVNKKKESIFNLRS